MRYIEQRKNSDEYPGLDMDWLTDLQTGYTLKSEGGRRYSVTDKYESEKITFELSKNITTTAEALQIIKIISEHKDRIWVKTFQDIEKSLEESDEKILHIFPRE